MQMRQLHRRPQRRQRQGGVTMLVVLVLLSVMLLGGLAFARLTEVSNMASGNASYREAAMQASEVGLNTVFEQVRTAIPDEELPVAGWYWPTPQPTDAQGVPTVDFNAAPEVVVGNYRLRYVAERLCNVTPVVDPLRDCLVRQEPQPESAVAGKEKPDPANARQFRVTVRVTGPKDTRSWVQALVTKG